MASADPQQERALDQAYDRATELWAAGSLRIVFNNYPDAIFLIDGGRIVDCNQSAVEMFRASRTEVLSWSVLDLSSSSHINGSPFIAKMNEMIAIAIERGSQIYSKEVAADRKFVADADAKQKFASEAVREAAAKWATEPYRLLEQKRLEQTNQTGEQS